MTDAASPQDVWTILRLLDWTQNYFEKHEITRARFEAEILLAHVLHINRLQLYLNFEQPLSKEELSAFKGLMKRRVEGCPMAYLCGMKEFWSLSFKVDEHVLIPRPDTERLLEVLKEKHPKLTGKAVDVGTGSGILSVCLAKEYPHLQVFGWDISAPALKLALENAKTHQVSERISFSQIDFLKITSFQQAPFDVFISNPPYICNDVISTLQPEVKDHEPLQALDGGPDGLDFYRVMCKNFSWLVKEDGVVCVEIGYDQGEKVSQLFAQAGLKNVEVIKDYAGHDRVIYGKK